MLVIDHVRNTGVGGSIIDGHKKAMELGADVDVVMAGDAQMDPAYLPNLLDPICHDGYEFTKANRFYSRTSYAGMPAMRAFGSVVLSFASKVASGYWNLFDPQNGWVNYVLTALHLPLAHTTWLDEKWTAWAAILAADAWRQGRADPGCLRREVSSMKISRVIGSIGLPSGLLAADAAQARAGVVLPVALLFFTGLALCTLGPRSGSGWWSRPSACRSLHRQRWRSARR